MNTRLLSRLAVFALVVLVLASVLTAATSANTVPSSRLTDQTRAITVNDLKPTECAAFNLTNILICDSSHTCNGTSADELILGSPDTNNINGKGGVNCCVGALGTTFSNCNWHN
jgi:hypothetical protein